MLTSLLFAVIGCSLPPLPNNTWSVRDGHLLRVHCNFTDEGWTLVCGDDGTWQNDAGNCSDVTTTTHAPEGESGSELPVSLVVAIAIGVGLGVVVGLVCLGVFVGFVKW